LNDNKKTRIDSNGIDGKVLNEASTKAIIQVKEDKKKEKLQKQIENLEKKTIASDNNAKMLLKTAEKNKLKILNLKK
jgi:deoxycytidine triphosphate deaminase